MENRRSFFKNRYSIPILILLFSLFVFNIKFRYTGGGDTVPNELLPISIIYERDFDLNEFTDESRKFPGDFSHIINGRVVSPYPIIPGILNLPVYLIAHILGVNLLEKRFLLSMLSSSIISSISVVFIYLCLLKVCRRQGTAIFFALTYAFATCVWSVTSRGIWQHGPSLLFITISLFLLLNKNINLIPYSGFFLGMAVFNRPINFLIALPLTFYVLFHHRKIFKRYILFAAIPAFLLCLYSYLYWGSLMSLGQVHPLKAILDGSFLSGLSGLLVSPSRGLFIFSPIFIFSFGYLFYPVFSKRVKPIYKYLSLSVVSFVLLCSKWFMWWGGHCFGYRLLIELTPILIIFLAVCWERVIIHHRYLKGIFLCFLLISVYVHFLGAFYYPSGFNSSPNDIDRHVERLWDFKDSEITRCTLKLLRKR